MKKNFYISAAIIILSLQTNDLLSQIHQSASFEIIQSNFNARLLSESSPNLIRQNFTLQHSLINNENFSETITTFPFNNLYELEHSNPPKLSIYSILNKSTIENDLVIPQVSSSGRIGKGKSNLWWGVLIGGIAGATYGSIKKMDTGSTLLMAGVGSCVGGSIVLIMNAYQK
jgi:hypothetical protein